MTKKTKETFEDCVARGLSIPKNLIPWCEEEGRRLNNGRKHGFSKYIVDLILQDKARKEKVRND